jgi:hypothetical protein
LDNSMIHLLYQYTWLISKRRSKVGQTLYIWPVHTLYYHALLRKG